MAKTIDSPTLDRQSFPDGFIFGTAGSSFQYEGATNEGGKSPSIWDHFSHTYPEMTKMHNGDVAIDFYHRYKDDIKLMKEINMDSFRFSISWSRLIPSGKLKDGVNKEGVQFYKDLIDELLANGIQPSMTLYHWDHPQSLDDEYDGFLSPKIVEDFRDFARICFEEFGEKVKLWATINEPYIMAIASYDNGNKAPGRCSSWVNEKSHAGDSSTEPYIVSHHILLAHAVAVDEFRKCKIFSHDSKIGIVLAPIWHEPYNSDSSEDKEAVERALAFEIGWHLDPLIHGDYPEIVKKYARDKLPSFTAEQSKLLKNSTDYVGINYYTARFATLLPHIDPEKPRCRTDNHVERKLTDHSGHIIGNGIGSGLILSYPEGLRKVLNYVKEKYNNIPVYIKENGIHENDDGTKPREEILNDTVRIEYHKAHFEELHKAIVMDGCDVRGYYAWSFMDNFEWESGYTARFGLYYVDFLDGLKRHPKDSAKWFKQFLKSFFTGSLNFAKVGSFTSRSNIDISPLINEAVAKDNHFDTGRSKSEVVVRTRVGLDVGHLLKSALAGGISCAFSAFLMHPVDTVKTQVQASTTLSFVEILSKIPEIGARGLYKGSVPAVVGQFASHGLRTSIYEASKLALPLVAPSLLDIQVQSMASFLGTVLGTTLRIPCEVLKQRLQANQFDNIVEATVSTWHQDGLKGLFRGTGVTLLREVPFYVAGMGLYNQSKKVVERRLGRELEPWEAIAVGALSGGFTAVLTTPFDVIKTRMMTAPQGVELSMWMAAYSILTHEGPLAFYKGAVPRFFWTAPLGALNLAGYELLQKAL